MQRFVMAGLLCVACAGTASAMESIKAMEGIKAKSAVEFYNAQEKRFFVSSDTLEVQLLDQGMVSGWERTGQVFAVIDPNDTAALGANPVCRLYSSVPGYENLHFFSASSAECAAAIASGGWTVETFNAFGAFLPEAATGVCRDGTRPLYRTVDANSGDHRYTVDAKVQEQMIGQGRVAEGYGFFPVAMCVLQQQ